MNRLRSFVKKYSSIKDKENEGFISVFDDTSCFDDNDLDEKDEKDNKENTVNIDTLDIFIKLDKTLYFIDNDEENVCLDLLKDIGFQTVLYIGNNGLFSDESNSTDDDVNLYVIPITDNTMKNSDTINKTVNKLTEHLKFLLKTLSKTLIIVHDYNIGRTITALSLMNLNRQLQEIEQLFNITDKNHTLNKDYLNLIKLKCPEISCIVNAIKDIFPQTTINDILAVLEIYSSVDEAVVQLAS